MASFFQILLLLSVAVAPVVTRKSKITRRSLIELAGEIKCSTKRSAIEYVSYGCYCGLGGHGKPIDEVDKCCQEHDKCFGSFKECQTKTLRYKWTCNEEGVECGINEDECAKNVCHCDREFAECLRGAPYDSKYFLYSMFHCDPPPRTSQSPDPWHSWG